ncbi:non-specific serine/threonine protein kinase [Haloechinothrix alba]|uniref:Non-specific serine/threonine protein kinase n=1 Tax=Haloechinothrix alba TaxID=664784 RepID=A0A238VDI4_9PSEU|nr:LuxR C-terminal-related transcriptional regulator [Haloechinothrix alba]SNR32465.1 non-specific serine/threonine protein kinase [Haloechinothrix alba]
MRAEAESLPAEVTGYIGRDAELQEVGHLLGATPLVTLTGPGGVGKSRLAQRVAASARSEFRDGVVFVGLADLRDPALLVYTVADRIGLGDRSARPAVELVVEALNRKRLLLVLDNCEHLVDACARLVENLLAGCSDLVVLATSRQSLGVPGERVVPVPPLAVPESGESVENLKRCESVRLLVDRANAVAPPFEVTEDNAADVVRLCHQLAGLPLTIELAAVRLRALSVGQLADRLSRQFTLLDGVGRRGPNRHETLRALIDWSYQLCTEPERLLWARSSVFSGSFGLEAAEAVCSGDGLDRHVVLDVIDGLLDKSVLLREERQGEARYRMLEPMRQYGEDRLRASGEHVAVRRRHRDWYFDLTAAFAAQWIGPDQAGWLDRLRREHADLRVALDFCAGDPAEAAVGMRMIFACKEYWLGRGLNTEGRIQLRKLLDAAPEDAPDRAHALWHYAFIALVQGDTSAFETALEKAAEAAEAVDDDLARAYVHHVRAYAALIGNDMPKAVDLFGIAASMFRDQEDLGAQLWSTFNYGLALGLAGDLDGGRRVLRETIAAFTDRGELFWRSWALWSLAAAEYLRGDLRQATDSCLEVLRLQQRVDDRVLIAFALTVMAGCAAHSGRPRMAARLLGASITVWQSLGASPNHYAAFVEPLQRDTDMVTGELGQDEAIKEFAIGSELSVGEAVAYALGEQESAGDMLVEQSHDPLTQREAQIAELVAEGLTNRAIADRLVIAQRTAETHIDHILTKLGFNNRAQIAVWVTMNRRS